MSLDAGDVVTIKRLAEEIGASTRTIRRWIADRSHPLPCYRPTRRTILIRRADFAAWYEASRRTEARTELERVAERRR